MRTDTEKPIPVGSRFARNEGGAIFTVRSFVNCTPKSTGATEAFWDYTLSYFDKKEEKELCVDSNHLARYFRKV